MLGTIMGARIEALAATVSKMRIPVEDRCGRMISSRQAARIAKGTGISKLSIVNPDVCTSDLCFHAAMQLLANQTFRREDIAAIIFISQTSDYLTPATSFYLQDRLGLPKDILAFDVNLGCSGFVYGVYLAGLILSGVDIDRKVLLCCGDTSSDNAFPDDTSMLSIAGDAGAVAVISKAPKNEDRKIHYNIDSYGEQANALLVARGGSRAFRITDGDGKLQPLRENYCCMDGTTVMNFSLFETVSNIKKLISEYDISLTDVEIVLLHQANKMIVNTIADKIGISRDKVPFCCEEIGNTSSASIPVCITELKRCANYKPYKTALLSGFGVGMSVASMLIDLRDMEVLETCEM